MHDIWNPWHGCVKYSEGCKNCYMYVLDKMRNQDGSHIYIRPMILRIHFLKIEMVPIRYKVEKR